MTTTMSARPAAQRWWSLTTAEPAFLPREGIPEASNGRPHLSASRVVGGYHRGGRRRRRRGPTAAAGAGLGGELARGHGIERGMGEYRGLTANAMEVSAMESTGPRG